MRELKIISLSIFFVASLWITSIYSFSVIKIEGGSQSLSSYQGKKILIITLPIQQSASADSMLHSLDTLASGNLSTLHVIAVPSFEDGYTPALQNQLKQWYRSKLGNHILITEGFYTRKTSGTQQHPLFKWLTKVTENEYFNMDVTGPGFKFFVRANGDLYGVHIPQTSLTSSAVRKTLQSQ